MRPVVHQLQRIASIGQIVAVPLLFGLLLIYTYVPVSYTHLDVYKRQVLGVVGAVPLVGQVVEAVGLGDLVVLVAVPGHKVCLLYTSGLLR